MLLFTLMPILVFLPTTLSECLKSFVLNDSFPSYEFDSDKYPISFVGKVRCYTRFTAPEGQNIAYECPEIKLEPSANASARGCQTDFLRIIVGDTLESYCRESSLERTVINSNRLALHYRIMVPRENGPYDGKRRVECTVYYVSPPTPSCSCGKKNTKSRIVGGEETEENEYPWQALLRRKSNNEHFCGGSVIANQWILSAAHCMSSFTAQDILVTLAEHNKITVDPISQTFEVIELITHPNYNTPLIDDNDIALLKLSTPVDYTDEIQPVCLPFGLEDMDISGKRGIVTGWGQESTTGLTTDVLFEASLNFLTLDDCLEISSFFSISDNMICAEGSGENDSCAGDSGGPLVWEGDNTNNYQIGIVSFGKNCADILFPGVYTKVTNYLDWIKETTGLDDEFCRPTPPPSL